MMVQNPVRSGTYVMLGRLSLDYISPHVTSPLCLHMTAPSSDFEGIRDTVGSYSEAELRFGRNERGMNDWVVQ